MSRVCAQKSARRGVGAAAVTARTVPPGTRAARTVPPRRRTASVSSISPVTHARQRNSNVCARVCTNSSVPRAASGVACRPSVTCTSPAGTAPSTVHACRGIGVSVGEEVVVALVVVSAVTGVAFAFALSVPSVPLPKAFWMFSVPALEAKEAEKRLLDSGLPARMRVARPYALLVGCARTGACCWGPNVAAQSAARRCPRAVAARRRACASASAASTRRGSGRHSRNSCATITRGGGGGPASAHSSHPASPPSRALLRSSLLSSSPLLLLLLPFLRLLPSPTLQLPVSPLEPLSRAAMSAVMQWPSREAAASAPRAAAPVSAAQSQPGVTTATSTRARSAATWRSTPPSAVRASASASSRCAPHASTTTRTRKPLHVLTPRVVAVATLLLLLLRVLLPAILLAMLLVKVFVPVGPATDGGWRTGVMQTAWSARQVAWSARTSDAPGATGRARTAAAHAGAFPGLHASTTAGGAAAASSTVRLAWARTNASTARCCAAQHDSPPTSARAHSLLSTLWDGDR